MRRSTRTQLQIALAAFLFLAPASVALGVENPTLKDVFRDWEAVENEVVTLDISFHRLDITPNVAKNKDGKWETLPGPTHQKYADAFSAFLEASPDLAESIDENALNKFFGSKIGWAPPVREFLGLSHYWTEDIFQSDRIHFRYEIKRPMDPKTSVLVRSETEEMHWDQFESRSQVNIKNGSSRIWTPTLDMFSSKPLKYKTLLQSVVETAVVESIQGTLRYTGPGFILVLSENDLRTKYFRFERDGRIQEDWYFGEMRVEGFPKISIPRATFQLPSKANASGVPIVKGWGDCASYVVKSVRINEELPDNAFELSVPKNTVIVDPSGNRTLAQ